jgi:hypothetical protein
MFNANIEYDLILHHEADPCLMRQTAAPTHPFHAGIIAMDQSARALLRSADQATNPAWRASVGRGARSRYQSLHRLSMPHFRWTKSTDEILVAINRFSKRNIGEHHSAKLKISESGY